MTAHESLALALRSATRALHHRLDHHPLLAPLLSQDVRIEQYATALCGLFRIVAPLEQVLADYIARHHPGYDYQKRRRAAFLGSDIGQLGYELPAIYSALPIIRNDAELVGKLYVLEGSTLGGRVIFRQLQKSLGIDQMRAGSFFYGHGEHSETMWQEFWRFAEPLCPTSDHAKAQQAACDVFATYLSILEDACHV
jgi:heme oxygenase